ncbi:MAG: hypothetical protein K2N16_08205, partial [Muribaculaceae bacterium]|nr:hypothetical protein [Muribaculaceae bacterium]
FTLKDGNGNVIGTYTTGSDGTVTVTKAAVKRSVAYDLFYDRRKHWAQDRCFRFLHLNQIPHAYVNIIPRRIAKN